MDATQSLIDAARQGDRAALERLLAVSQPDVQRYAKIQCATITKRLELLGHSGAKLAARLDVRKAEPAIG